MQTLLKVTRIEKVDGDDNNVPAFRISYDLLDSGTNPDGTPSVSTLDSRQVDMSQSSTKDDIQAKLKEVLADYTAEREAAQVVQAQADAEAARLANADEMISSLEGLQIGANEEEVATPVDTTAVEAQP